MAKKYVKIFIIIALLLVLNSVIFADERDPIDIIIALDKSNSMVEEIGAVKDFVNSVIIDQWVQEEDLLLIINFYGKTEVSVNQIIAGDADKTAISQKISQIRANGSWTDIGNALDTLKQQLDSLSDEKRDKFLLLITDGKHDPPKTSKYYAPGKPFNHKLLANAWDIQKAGWKVQILDIGTTASIQDLARHLSGIYTEISEEVTEEELEEKTEEFLSTAKVTEWSNTIALDGKGNGIISMKIQTQGYKNDISIKINEIELTSGQEIDANVLQTPFEMTLPAQGEKTADISVKLSQALSRQDYDASLHFFFASEEHFMPVVLSTQLHVKSFLENYWWLIPLCIIVLIIIILVVIFLLLQIQRKNTVKFKLDIVENPLKKGKDIFRIRKGQKLYLNESITTINIVPKKNQRSMAELLGKGTGVGITYLLADRFLEPQKTPGNIINKSFLIRTESGMDFHIKFLSID